MEGSAQDTTDTRGGFTSESMSVPGPVLGTGDAKAADRALALVGAHTQMNTPQSACGAQAHLRERRDPGLREEI